MHGRPLLASAVTVALAAALGSGAAPTAEAAVTPGTLTVPASPGLAGTGVQVAANRSGAAVAVWRTPGSHGAAFRSATRAPGRAWSRPGVAVKIPRGPAYHLLKVVLDDRGTAHLLWSVSARGKGGGHLYVATKRRSGGWSRRQEVGPATIHKTLDVVEKADLAVAPDGTASVLWVAGGNDESVLVVKHLAILGVQTQARGSSRWSKAKVLFTGQNAAGVDLQVDRRGNALATWVTQPPEIDSAPARFAFRTAHGRWSKPHALPDLAGDGDTAYDRPTLVDGRIHLFNQQYTGGGGSPAPGTYALLGRSGTPSTPEPIALPGEAARSGGWLGGGTEYESAAAVDGTGRPTVVYPTDAAVLPKGG
ncbi:MAG: hypothetical protein AAGC46_11195, partial [Solirubrobacteraceae bacterium]